MPHDHFRVLVVDDSAIMRQLLRVSLLQHFECAVTEATDGAQALERIHEASFDLVITDINMPTMDGLQLIRAIRARHDTLPIIIVTTHGAERDRDEGLRLGADTYITKPVDPALLLAAIRRALRGGGADGETFPPA